MIKLLLIEYDKFEKTDTQIFEIFSIFQIELINIKLN